MDIRKFRKYYLNEQNMTHFMKNYENKPVHLCSNYEDIVRELINRAYAMRNSYNNTYHLHKDIHNFYRFDFSKESFVMINKVHYWNLIVFTNDNDFIPNSVPLYCIKEAWNYMENENKIEETTIGETTDKSLPLKMLSNLDILKKLLI